MLHVILSRGACCALLAALFACATPSPPGPREKVPDATQRSFVEHAYAAGPSVAIRQSSQTLDGPDGPLQINLLAPRLEGSYPLVIYLPGLGDVVNSGEPWRKAWAEAGFAVLSVQDRQDGMPLLASEKARRGDIAGMVRDANSDARREIRVKELLFALAAAREAKEPMFRSIDFSRVTLAGFDTGAFTALAFGGESASPAPENAIPGLKAIVAISPALPDGFVPHGRYTGAGLPVLVVSSDADFDEYGLVTDIGMRIAPFHAMPRNDKYLLSFKRVSHRQLAGDASAGTPRAMSGMPSRKGGPLSGGGGGMPGGGGKPGGAAGMAPPGTGRAPSFGAPEAGGETMQLAMRSVTQAFLQSYVLGNAAALDWLSLDAPRWLRPYASLTIK